MTIVLTPSPQQPPCTLTSKLAGGIHSLYCTSSLHNMRQTLSHDVVVHFDKFNSKSSSLRAKNHLLNATSNPCSSLGRRNYFQVGSMQRQYDNKIGISIRCQAGRRHHRRRGEPPGGRSLSTSASGSKDPRDDKVEITLDYQFFERRVAEAATTTKNAVTSSVRQVRQAGETFIQDGKHAWKELRSSVAVRNDKHVVISLKRSTIDFAGRTILWTVLTILFSRCLLVFAKRFRWGWEEGFSWPRNFRVRDRSLGGKEVTVSKEVKLWEGGPVKKAFNRPVKGVSPLDNVMATSRSEKDLQRLKMENDPRRFKRVQRGTQLPAWWPVSHPVHTMPPEACVQGQRDAHILLCEMMEKRLSGVDFGEYDICKLRQLCRDSGAKVSFDTANTRDSFYRAAIQVVLNACSSGSKGLLLEYGKEEPAFFMAGLAGNIGLEAEKAATMTIAAVAARTRAGFIQAWALHMQGKQAEVDEELRKIVRMHTTFSPNPNSPEMELVGRGLSYFGLEERRQLLSMYVSVEGSNTENVAREALGLVSTPGRQV